MPWPALPILDRCCRMDCGVSLAIIGGKQQGHKTKSRLEGWAGGEDVLAGWPGTMNFNVPKAILIQER